MIIDAREGEFATTILGSSPPEPDPPDPPPGGESNWPTADNDNAEDEALAA